MDDQRWKELCRLIMLEKDPQKLWTLVSELNQEFEKREETLRAQEQSTSEPGKDGLPDAASKPDPADEPA